MKPEIILLITLASGIFFFMLSVVLRKRRKTRRILISLGILTGIIPLLLWFSFSLWGFIKERPFIGNYVGDTYVMGMADLDMFGDNTFILKSDSCSSGFVQGTWEYSFQTKQLEFESTSQNMGKARIINRDSIEFINIPICIRLAKKFTVGKTGKPTTIPIINKSF